jgi:hypothetical protein
MTIPAYYKTASWKALRKSVLKRDRYVCQYCDGRAATADHVIPRRKGGPDTLDNLVAVCHPCNKVAGGAVFQNVEVKREWIRRTRGITEGPPEKTKAKQKIRTRKLSGWRKKRAIAMAPEHIRQGVVLLA